MENSVLLLKNANVIDVVTGKTIYSHLLIQNGFITKIVSAHKPIGYIHKKAVIYDLKRRFVIPGLIDMHVHMKGDYAPIFTASGVTTVRNTGGNIGELKKIINASSGAPTPRIISADRIIDGPPGLWGENSPWNININDACSARAEVKRQVEAGADFIKVYGWLKKEMMKIVVEEAKLLHKEVSCDLVHSIEVTATEAAKMGIKWNEHASGIIKNIFPNWTMQADENIWETIDWKNPDMQKIIEVCKILVENKVVLCPTMVLYDQVNLMRNYWYPEEKIMNKLKENAVLMQHWRRFIENTSSLNSLGIQHTYNKAITKAYFELGGTVVAGSDTPAGIFTIPGMALHRELELFVEIGLSEIDALRTATIKAAEALDRQDIGVIQEGTIADMVVLEKNPLKDIRNTKEIHFIIKGGTVYSQDDLLDKVPTEENIKKSVEEFMNSFLDTNYKSS
ncbi:amidohydrolase family protein [Psychrobacillus sp. FSL K6-2684]|uniref:amidohydrolase family protein n=1 Tax=Psychrobacillus sp. FSL K6-2684 TaxID=2921547 RepID=UPI0030FADF95